MAESIARRILAEMYSVKEEHLGELLGGKVDLVSKKALKPRIGRRILAEAVYA